MAHEEYMFFDRNYSTCCKPFNHGGFHINITLNSTHRLEGVRVVFHSHNYPNFTVVSGHNQSEPCIQSESGKFLHSSKSQVTFDCSSKNDRAETLHMAFEKTEDQLSICQIYLFFQPIKWKCDTADAPLHGIIHETFLLSDKSFNFYCDPGFDLHGQTSTVCARNGLWTQETPTCVKKTVEWRRMRNQGKKQQLEQVYQVIIGVLGIIVIGGIVFALYFALSKRRTKRRFGNRSNHSSQSSNSLDVSFYRDRVPSVSYSVNPGFSDKEPSEQQERPQMDVPDILGHRDVRSLAKVRALKSSPSQSGSTNEHIYADPVYDDLEGDKSKKLDRKRKSDFVMTDNEYYVS